MLRFIYKKCDWHFTKERISIHPMLRFIIAFTSSSLRVSNFNTSHVTVYPIRLLLLHIASTISIHPMLRFIGSGCWNLWIGLYISIHPMLRFILNLECIAYILPNFNTSHVTVYQYPFIILILYHCLMNMQRIDHSLLFLHRKAMIAVLRPLEYSIVRFLFGA